MPKYRIIYVEDIACNWQVQKRVCLFFWENIYLSFSSATTAANEVLNLMREK